MARESYLGQVSRRRKLATHIELQQKPQALVIGEKVQRVEIRRGMKGYKERMESNYCNMNMDVKPLPHNGDVVCGKTKGKVQKPYRR